MMKFVPLLSPATLTVDFKPHVFIHSLTPA